MVKCAVEMKQFDIIYEPQTSVKAQALADFIQENTHVVEDRVWELDVDGSATRQGKGVGTILISSIKEELDFAVRFHFWASNNEDEYEALLQGLRLAEQAEAKCSQ